MPSRSRTPLALLVVGLSLLAAWVLRDIAPPSLIRDGKRLPVGLMSQHVVLTSHHGADSGGAPSPVSDSPLPHFLGGLFLAVHLLAAALAIGIPLIRRLLARLRLAPDKFIAQLLFALVAALTTGVSVLFAAKIGYGDRLEPRAAVQGGAQVARYAFVAALAVVVVFGVPWTSTGKIQHLRSVE